MTTPSPETRTEVEVEELARLICPTVKPYLDEVGVTAHPCRCQGKYVDPDYGTCVTMCFGTMARIARVILSSGYRRVNLAEQTGWRPIETAPKDGTRIIGWQPSDYMPRGRVVFMSWRADDHTEEILWLGDDHDDFSVGLASTPYEPTLWQPLPPPPAGDKTT